MEDRGYRGEPDDSDKPSANSAESSFSAWLKKNLRIEAEDKEEKEDEEKKESSKDKAQKKSTKFGQFLRRLLGGNAPKSEQNGIIDEQTSNRLPLFGLGEAKHQSIEPEQPSTLVVESAEASTQLLSSSEELGVLRIDHQNEDEPTSSSAEAEEHDFAETDVDTSQHEQINDDHEKDTDGQQTIDSESDFQEIDYSREEETAQAATDQEPHFYAGRAEPILRDEIERLKRKARQQEQATKQAKSQAARADSQLHIVQEQQKAFEQQLKNANLSTSAEVAVKPTGRPEIKEPVQISPEQQSKKELKVESKLDTKVLFDTTPEKPIKAPEVLEVVAKAAERNVPIESRFERRHEIKDEPTNQQVYGGATPVSAILQSTTPQYAPPINVPTPPSAEQVSQYKQSQKTTQQYTLAAKDGFIAGLSVLLLIILITRFI